MLRDRRTLIAMIGIPLILYPALFVFGSQAAIMQQDKLDEAKSRIAVGGVDSELVKGWLAKDRKLLVLSPINPDDALLKGALDAYVMLPDDFAQLVDDGKTARVTVRYDASDTTSQEASRRVADTLNDSFDALLRERLARAGLSEEYARPIEVERHNVAPPEKTTGAMLGLLMPLIMIVMVGVGAFYPAIDLTAGEKERGTFETLLSTPTQSMEILAGKFLTVFSIAVITGLTNLGSMLTTLAFQFSQLQDDNIPFSIRIPLGSFLLIFVSILPLAFLISAVMMSVAVLARSFREGQSLLTPVLILIVFPAAIATIPGTRLTTATQLMPIANFSLLFKDLMIAQASAESVAVVLVSTTVYAAIALIIAARMFQREDVVLSVDAGLPITLRRSMIPPRAVPTPGMSLLVLSVCLLLLFYAGTYIQSNYGLAGVAMTQWLLFLAPTLFMLWYARVSLREALAIKAPAATAFAAALLIGLGWSVWSQQLSVWQDWIWPFPAALAEEMTKLLQFDDAPLIILLLVLAVSPAICEEFLFRGALLSGLRNAMPTWALILFVAVAFGASHLVIQRMTVTAVSGIVLTYMVWRSGSIFTGMIGHVLVNSIAVLIQTQQLPAAAQAIANTALGDGAGFPAYVLAISALLCAIGIGLIEFGSRKKEGGSR
ncbi:MAG: CPBP family intramembrane metalloprotease [Candidatus Hydrogenedentes bacterium]|nr:CPBP family intramembrane metalloprotease [Candidatus Hydrogenedentota bacterium]